MKERPILFNGEMVQAVLAGKKTQTRRFLNPQPECYEDSWKWRKSYSYNKYGLFHLLIKHKCPYGKIGDRLWVRETFSYEPGDGGLLYRATDPGWDDEQTNLRWKPSIFMPRVASRILLEVVDVKIERVTDISPEDVINEGVSLNRSMIECVGMPATDLQIIEQWIKLWDSINGKKEGRSWEDNPWVWVVEFKVIEVKGDTNE